MSSSTVVIDFFNGLTRMQIFLFFIIWFFGIIMGIILAKYFDANTRCY